MADALGASVMGFEPRKIKHIKISAPAVPGTLDLTKVSLSQDWRPFIRQFTIERTSIDRVSVLFFNSYPLGRAGYMRTLQGKGGGVRLAVPPRQITVKEVIDLVDGPTALAGCFLDAGYCPLKKCRLGAKLKEAQKQMDDVLAATTIEDLLDKGREDVKA